MLKFLRKYNTLILVVGGSLLMVVFLVPQAIQQLGQNPSNVPYAKIDGEVISYQDLSEARDDWQRVNQILGEAVLTLQIQDVDHWMLLLHEAEKYGLVGGPTDGALGVNFFAEYVGSVFAMREAQQNPWFYQDPQQFQSLLERNTSEALTAFQTRLEAASSTGTREIVYYRAIAKLRGVARLLDTYNSLAGDSIPEIQLAGADMYDRVTADVGIIPASAFRPDPASLEMDALREHFETYKSIAPGEGDFGFGYLMPDGVKYEALRVNADAIKQSLSAEPADELEYFRRNRSNYGSRTFEEARDRVRTDYLNSVVKQRMDKIANDLRRESTRAEQALPKDPSAERYRIIPEGHTGPSLETYTQTALEASELEGEAADDLVTLLPAGDAFLSEAELAQSSLKDARFVITANERIPFAQALMGAKEFRADERLDIQRGLLFGPLMISSGGIDDLLFVRITDVRFEGPAESVEEVEERVREDLATLRGYEELTQRAETFREAFADGGFDWFNSMEFVENVESRQYPNAVIGLDTVQQASGTELTALSRTAFPEGVMIKARQLNPLEPIEDRPADDRTAGVLMPSNLSLGLATITSFRPTTHDRIREGSSLLRQRVVRNAQNLSTVAPYSFESLARRLGFERLDVNEDDV